MENSDDLTQLIAPHLYIENVPAPDPHLFSLVHKTLLKIENTLDEEKIEINDPKRGILTTKWFGVHKGEVKVKFEVVVWDKGFQVEGWQQLGLIFKKSTKTKWARLMERKLISAILDSLAVQS